MEKLNESEEKISEWEVEE